MVKKFVSYLQKEKRYSNHTLLAYECDLNQLQGYLYDTFDVSNIENANSVMIRSWMVSLSESGISSKSINRKLSSAKSFFHFLRKIGKVITNPVSKISGPKIPKRLPQYLKENEASALLNVNCFPEDWLGLRDRLILTLLYECGLRRSECLSLRKNDVIQGQYVLKVLGKGNKERLIPIRKELLEMINSYIEERDQKVEVKHDYIFVTLKGNPLYPKALYNIVVEYVGRVTSLQRKGPHTLRHTFATHLTNQGAEIKAIQELLGHASLAATQIYTHNSIEKLKRVYKNAHPKS